MTSRKPKDAKGAENEAQYAEAYPFHVKRSDGTEMPAEYSQYERVEEGSKPIIEWQNKLGQALAAELLPDMTQLYYLPEFPAHYHLRVYQAKEDTKRSQAKHYYLFGYPEEPGGSKARKYYRSPNHFLPHLLWLVGDSEDRGDCACEFCSGSKPITSKAAKAKALPSSGQTTVAAATSAPPSAPIHSSSATAPTQKNTAASQSDKQRPTNQPSAGIQQHTPHEPQIAAPHQAPAPDPGPSAPQPPYPVAHDVSVLFRAGEVVWFKNNNSWRVGMILASGAALTIAPFGHPLYQTQEVIKQETDIRPFLAFSIPQINAGLHEFKGQALAQMDWQVLQEKFGAHTDASRREGLAIEATKLAATRVDQCFSTFNPLQGTVLNYDVFGGIFLGAEKICIGEAVRILFKREQQDSAPEKGMPIVMVIEMIYVGRQKGNLMLKGSMWKLKYSSLAQQPETSSQVQLPATMIGEKKFRDGILLNRGWRVEWVLLKPNVSVDEAAIRGRFYETGRLTPILNPAQFETMLQQQVVEDIQTLLNNRGDSNGPRVGRVSNRAQAVAGAVPVGVPASLGPDVLEA
ncbi:hypothetical protein F4777DRAFT_258762 [Nemania sp. FL0916]|nr:hypothetical protein F4777DRAFT_258762 [Nemania sp. FL0916]